MEPVEPYAAGESILDQLTRVRLWLARHQIRFAERDAHPDPRSRHMFVSDAEFGLLLRNVGGTPEGEALAGIENSLAALDSRIQERLELTMLEGRSAPLEDLRAHFRLSDSELDILVALAAPEISNRLARAYTNAWADFTRKQSNVNFLLELLGTDWQTRQTLREALMPGAPLRRFALVQVAQDDRWHPSTPLLHCNVRLSDRLVDFLCGGPRSRLDAGIAAGASVQSGHMPLSELLVPEPLKQGFLRMLKTSARHRDKPLRLAMLGPPGCGRRTLVAAGLTQVGRGLMVVDGRRLPTDPADLQVWLRTALRDARLAQSELYLEVTGTDWVTDLSEETQRALVDFLDHCPDSVFVGSDAPPHWIGLTPGFVSINVPFPTFEVQEALWRRHLAGKAVLEEGFEIEGLVASYSLSGGAIGRAAEEAIHRCRLRTRGARLVLAREEVIEAAQAQLSHRLGMLAEKVTRMLTWEDLVLPDKILGLLHDLVDQYRHQNRVFNEWGFRTKVAYGRGLSALFHGPPGTGKTMVAGIIARALGLELYKIDLSRVVDKYIGETEKNLGRIFDEATRSKAILLFDEADSLFSKRTAVKSSHDRYANLETNFLLQRIESFEGVCLLTTNFESSIDDAFKRRLRFKIAFPLPESEERKMLWTRMIPEEADVGDNIDFDGLAKEFEMTGGHIKNAVLRGAFAAARAGSAITQDVLFTAAREEYREMGKLVRD